MRRPLPMLCLVAPLVSFGASDVSGDDALVPSPRAMETMVTVKQASLSCGSANRGSLRFGAVLEPAGEGYVVPPTWQKRSHQTGTDELVALIARVAKTIASQYPGSILGVADLSKPSGGATRGHRSHQCGRDVDLLYYARDPAGNPFPPDDLMPIYRGRGKAIRSKAPTWRPKIPERYFDLERNWALVKALITDKDVHVTRIFVAYRIKMWLLNYAEKAKEPKWLHRKAMRTLTVPSKADVHNDHMHIRIACSEDDIKQGRCRDANAPPRRRGKWHSKIACPPRPRKPTPKTQRHSRRQSRPRS